MVISRKDSTWWQDSSDSFHPTVDSDSSLPTWIIIHLCLPFLPAVTCQIPSSKDLTHYSVSLWWRVYENKHLSRDPLVIACSASYEAAQPQISRVQQICDSILALLNCNPVLSPDTILEDMALFRQTLLLSGLLHLGLGEFTCKMKQLDRTAS